MVSTLRFIGDMCGIGAMLCVISGLGLAAYLSIRLVMGAILG